MSDHEEEEWSDGCDEEDEDDSNCSAFGQQLFSFGSEDCEFCPRAEECRGATIQHESFGKKEASL